MIADRMPVILESTDFEQWECGNVKKTSAQDDDASA